MTSSFFEFLSFTSLAPISWPRCAHGQDQDSGTNARTCHVMTFTFKKQCDCSHAVELCSSAWAYLYMARTIHAQFIQESQEQRQERQEQKALSEA